jgi:hypothetical protein
VRFAYRRQGEGNVLIRLEQQEPVMLFPVTVTLNYQSGGSEDVVIAVSEALTERVLPLKSPLRSVAINDDHAALVRIDK